jgi:carboxylesterase type B
MLKSFWDHKIEYGLIGLNRIGGTRLITLGPSGVFPEAPYEMLRRAAGKRNVTMMAGFVKHDGSFYLPILWDAYQQRGLVDQEMSVFDILDDMNNLVGVNDKTGMAVGALIELLDLDEKKNVKFLDLVEEIHDLAATALIKGPILKEAQANLKKGARTYLYTFDYEGEHTICRYMNMDQYPFKGGVHHSNDNIYMYSYPNRHTKLNERDTKMAQKMIDLWSSFVLEGVPKAVGVPEWPEMTRK